MRRSNFSDTVTETTFADRTNYSRTSINSNSGKLPVGTGLRNAVGKTHFLTWESAQSLPRLISHLRQEHPKPRVQCFCSIAGTSTGRQGRLSTTQINLEPFEAGLPDWTP